MERNARSDNPCGALCSSGLGDIMLPPVMKEYNACNISLRNQIEFYKQEHNSLRADVTALLEENQQLAAQLKVALGSSLGQEPAGECRRRTADMVANLQRQLLLTSQEKAAAMELYQNAVKEIETLENDLATCRQCGANNDTDNTLDEVRREYSTAINMLEDKVGNLEKEVGRERSRRVEMENEMSRLRIEKDRLANDLRDCRCQVQDASQAQQAANAQLDAERQRAHEAVSDFERLRRERDELEQALIDTSQRTEELGRRELAALARVEEALTLVDAAVLEKDAALTAEARSHEEVSRLGRSVEQLLEEAGKRIAEETGRLKQHFTSQLETLLRDIRDLQEDVARKQTQLAKATADLQRLEGELESMRKDRAMLPDPVQMQNSLDNTYRELVNCEKQGQAIAADRDRLLQRLEDLDKNHRAEMAGAQDAIFTLRQELQACRQQAEQVEAAAQARALLLEDQISKLEQQLNCLQCAGQTPIPDEQVHVQCEAQLEEYRRIVGQLTEMQQRGMRVAQELQSHLDAQVEAKMRWQNEVKTLSSRFENRIDSLRNQLGGLKRANRNLELKLASNQVKEDYDRDCSACPPCQW